MFRNSCARFITCLIAVMMLIGGGNIALAEVPHLISYQGHLTDDVGNPLDTIVDMTFALFNDSLGTTKYWEEVHSNVTIDNGLFEVRLGSVVALNATVLSADECWLGISLDGGGVMQPMTPMTSVLYACRADRSDTAGYASTADHATTSDHADTADIALSGSGNGWMVSGNVVRLETTTDSVGIGTTGPRAPLEVQGTGHAIIGESQGTGTAAGVYGANDGTGFGLMGVSTHGRGVTGISSHGFGGHFFGPKHYFSNRVGIGTESPDQLLHLYTDASDTTNCIHIESAHPSNWQTTGMIFTTPENSWHLFMEGYWSSRLPDGALGLVDGSNDMAMTWTSDGRVGIGTTTPNYPLEVLAEGSTLRARCYGSGIGVYTSSGSGFGLYSDAPVNFLGGWTGFGQTNPTHRITVNGAIGLQSGGDTKYHINYYTGGFNISETGIANHRLFLKDGGNVGIGTSNPTEKLYVNGNAYIDGGAHVAGTFHADAFEADAIGRDNIEDEVGVAYASNWTVTILTTSWTTTLTKSITIPTDGYILAFGSCNFSIDHGISDPSSGTFTISDIPDDPNGTGAFRSHYYLGSNVNAGDYKYNLSCQRLFYKSAGTHTFHVVAYSLYGEGNELYSSAMALLFLPTPYGSKNGVVSNNPADNITAFTAEKQRFDLNHARAAQSRGAAKESVIETSNAALLQQVEALTAKIEALESRLQAVEKE